MKKIIFTLLAILSLSIISSANSSSMIMEYEKAGLCYEIIEENEGSLIVEISDGDVTWFHVIAAIGTLILPEAVEEICVRTVGDPELCGVVYDVTAALVSLRGVKIYKGVTKGFNWIANRGKAKSKAVIETKTYHNAEAVKTVFDTYKKIGCVKWDDVSASDINNNKKICDIPKMNATSSTYLKPSSYNTYYPNNVLDGDPTTPWVEGGSGQGYGEWLKIEFSQTSNLNGIMIMNGYNYLNADHVGDRYFKNSRVKRATLKFSDGSTKIIYLRDTNKYQTFNFSERKTRYVLIEIDEVYKGTKWTDTCISEINFLFK